VIGVSTSTSAGPTALGGYLYGAAFYYEYPDGSKVYAVSRWTTVASGLRFFDKDGVLLCSASSMPAVNNLRTMLTKDSMEMFFIDASYSFAVGQLSKSAGIYAFMYTDTFSDSLNTVLPNGIWAGCSENLSAYYYLAGMDGRKKMWRIDTSAKPYQVISSLDVFTAPNTALSINKLTLYQSTSIVVSSSDTNIYFLDKTNLQVSLRVATGYSSEGSIFNNLDSTHFYTVQFSAKTIRDFNIVSGSSTAILNFPSPVTSGFAYYLHPVNFGPFDYLGYVSQVSQYTLLVISKSTFTPLPDTLTFIQYVPAQYTFLSTEVVGNRVYLGLVVQCGTYNYQSHYVVFDMCQTRLPSLQCSLCYSDYYHDPADNTNCLHFSTLAAGVGIDTVTQTTLACSEANCVDCKQDYSVCIACSPTYTLTSGSCTPSVPTGPTPPSTPPGGPVAPTTTPTTAVVESLTSVLTPLTASLRSQSADFEFLLTIPDSRPYLTLPSSPPSPSSLPSRAPSPTLTPSSLSPHSLLSSSRPPLSDSSSPSLSPRLHLPTKCCASVQWARQWCWTLRALAARSLSSAPRPSRPGTSE